MQIESGTFSFLIPDSWSSSTEAGRLVYEGPCAEELIVSVSSARNDAGVSDSTYLDQLFLNATSSIEETLRERDLETVRPLSADPACLLPCQVALSRSADGSTLFSQVAVRAPEAVLFATLETPASVPHTTLLASFIRSLRAVETAPSQGAGG